MHKTTILQLSRELALVDDTNTVSFPPRPPPRILKRDDACMTIDITASHPDLAQLKVSLLNLSRWSACLIRLP